MYIFYRHINSENVEMMWVPDYLAPKIDNRLLSVVISKAPDDQVKDNKASKKLELEIQPYQFFYNDYINKHREITMSDVRLSYISRCDKAIMEYLIEKWSSYSWYEDLRNFLKENLDRIYDYATVKDIIE